MSLVSRFRFVYFILSHLKKKYIYYQTIKFIQDAVLKMSISYGNNQYAMLTFPGLYVNINEYIIGKKYCRLTPDESNSLMTKYS